MARYLRRTYAIAGLRQGEDYSVPIFEYAVKSPLDNGVWYDNITKARVIAKQGMV